MNMMEPITSFRKEHEFLSNFFLSKMIIDGKEYLTVEHWYQANKASNERDHEFIRLQKTPSEAKHWGKAITIRSGWNNLRMRIMIRGAWEKFQQNSDLRRLLIATHPRPLVEGNDWGDQFWGVRRGTGENHLGRILMLVREKIRQ